MNVYQEVTDKIIEQIEAGTPPWRKPWTGSASSSIPLRHNGEQYHGINVLMLWMQAQKNGFISERWMTFRQAKELGGHVRKGEKSSIVVKYGTFTKEFEGEEKKIPYARAYRVFNVDQIDGLPDEYHAMPDEPRDLGTKRDSQLDSFFDSTGAKITTSRKPQAYYSPLEDLIHMPPIETFHSAAGYYGTLAHESVHWTGHKSRLDRLKRFGNRSDYAFEELVAEIGNCMLCTELGVTPDFEQSASYVEGWLKALKSDTKFIFRASSAAQKAVDYLKERQDVASCANPEAA